MADNTIAFEGGPLDGTAEPDIDDHRPGDHFDWIRAAIESASSDVTPHRYAYTATKAAPVWRYDGPLPVSAETVPAWLLTRHGRSTEEETRG